MTDFEPTYKDLLKKQKIKVETEEQTRSRLIKVSRFLGCEQDMKAIFAKYDALLARCTDAKERDAISRLGAQEINYLLGKNEGFSHNGVDVK